MGSYQTTFALLLLTLAASNYIELPTVNYPKNQDIKEGELFVDPSCPLEGILMRNVSLEVKGGTQPGFPPCQVSPPELSVSNFGFELYNTHFQEASKIVTRFQEIRHSQFQLDSFVDQKGNNQFIYIILQTGVIKIYRKFEEDPQAFYYNEIVIPLPADQLLEIGYFVKISSESLLFVNNRHCIKVGLDAVTTMEGYTPIAESDSFETAVSVLDGKFLAVASEKKGVQLYKVEESVNKLKEDLLLSKEDLLQYLATEEKSLTISDIAYDEVNADLYVLDVVHGIFKVQLLLVSDQASENQTDNEVGYDEPTLIHNESLCDILYLDKGSQALYAACESSILKVHVATLEKEVLPHPIIKIREIEAMGRIIVYTGRNIFKIYDEGTRQFLEYYQYFSKINKIHLVMDGLFQGQFYFTNERLMVQGDFRIVSPSITCQTRDEAYIGKRFSVVMSSMGPCNRDYIEGSLEKWEQKDNSKSDRIKKIEFSESDTCVYQVRESLYFWRPGTVNTQAILIGLLVFLGIGTLVLLVWIVYKCRINRLAALLTQYVELDEKSDMNFSHNKENNNNKSMGKHEGLVEEMEEIEEKQVELGGENEDVVVAESEEGMAGKIKEEDVNHNEEFYQIE